MPPLGSALEPSETSPQYLPEPSRTWPQCLRRNFCTLRNLARNLVLKLHGIASEPIWAKDPIAKCCCWGKKKTPKTKNYFTSSDPHRDIILKHIRHKFWHSFCPSVSRFHQNYPLLLVPSPGSGSSSDHCDLSSQTDSNWPSLCLIQNSFRRPGVSGRLGVWRRLGAWKLRFERYKTIWLS